MKIISKIKSFILLLPMVAGVALTQSCTEDIDTSSRYTFTGNTVLSYLEDHADVYSEYRSLLATVKVSAERARALIAIAHPSVREDLDRAAAARFGHSYLRLK